MKPSLSFFGIPIGISIAVWSIIGIIRYFTEFLNSHKVRKLLGREIIIFEAGKKLLFKKNDIAVIIAAHNEELVIRRCIQALKQSLSKKQIYIISDGSSDKTYRRALMEGVHVSRIKPGGIGKAKALVYGINKYHLYEKYKFIFIVDADTQIDKNFIYHALDLFKDPRIGVVFACVKIHWPRHIIPRLSYYFISYRERLTRLLQYFLTYGQTWVYTNVNYVTPGFATIYKSSILKQLEIDTPGLIIEDFNLAFQLHRKKLCKVGYSPQMIGWDQHPDNLKDYWKQVRRWNIGFFQTVRKNGIWPSFFWLTLALFSFEVILNSIFILILPFIIFFLIMGLIAPYNEYAAYLFDTYKNLGIFENTTLLSILLGTFLIDYLFTIFIAINEKKPQMLFYGLFFYFMHFVTSLILFSSFIPGFFGKGDGKWVSPKRHSIGLATN